ncbi:hypothetical protein HY090_03175 [Candidatus Kaiserbacteria bacterium]|nr:hypothetical protein [Candidatus Kaiserbacteria bacterium]
MNKTLLYIVGTLILLVIAWMLLIRAYFPVSFNFSLPLENVAAVGAAQNVGTTTISARYGGSLSVRNFLKDPDMVKVISLQVDSTFPEPDYSLGSLPYGVDGFATTSSLVPVPDSLTRGYEMLYLSSQKTFSIFIYKEPIGQVRQKMTQDLEERLGLSASDICNVLAFVWITPLANKLYLQKNVGFPGCPLAVVLPTN